MICPSLIKKITSLILLLWALVNSTLFAQTDTVFWFAAPDISHNGAPTEILDRPIYIRMSTLSAPTVVTISEPANPLFTPKTINIPANTTSTVDLTPDIKFVEDTVPDGILNHGILIHSTALIGAYYENSSPTNPEIFALKGKNALGTSFYTPFQNLWQNAPSYHPAPYSAFDIVATQDNTVITISPKQDIVGHLAGSTFSVTLNKGQTYSARATSEFPGFHLGGSKVSSSKPIAVTVKDDLLLNNNFCADLAGDQIVPISIIGTEYIVMNGFLTPGAL